VLFLPSYLNEVKISDVQQNLSLKNKKISRIHEKNSEKFSEKYYPFEDIKWQY